MKIKTILEDNWSGITNQEREYSCKNFEQVATVIKNLNGANKTMVVLMINETRFLTIGGGNEGRYVCYLTEEDRMHNLVNLNTKNKLQIEIVAGGQYGLFDPKLCMSFEDVLKASEFFCNHGKSNPAQTWEEEV